MFAAQTTATTLKLHVTLRKAFGFGSMVMSLLGFDNQVATFAYPGATMGAMSAAALSGSRRLQAVKKYLTVNLNVDSSRIKTAGRRPAITASGPESDSLAAVHSRQVDISIVGRQALILAKPETSLLAASSAERAAHADSLAPGGVSAPFLSRGLYYIVRLNKREPPRIKTFEEAQIEVSSVYQETESKRLEDQWLKSLHARYPVVVNTETLRAAFAPVKQ